MIPLKVILTKKSYCKNIIIKALVNWADYSVKPGKRKCKGRGEK